MKKAFPSGKAFLSKSGIFQYNGLYRIGNMLAAVAAALEEIVYLLPGAQLGSRGGACIKGMHRLDIYLICLLLEIVDRDNVPLKVGKLLFKAFEISEKLGQLAAERNDYLCHLLCFVSEAAHIEHVKSENNILDTVYDLIEGGGKLHYIITVDRGEKFAQKLFAHFVLFEVCTVLDGMHFREHGPYILTLVICKAFFQIIGGIVSTFCHFDKEFEIIISVFLGHFIFLLYTISNIHLKY